MRLKAFIISVMGAALWGGSCSNHVVNEAGEQVEEHIIEPTKAQNTDAVHSLAGTKPNILIIVADDLGYSDLGIMGGEIDTPNLDALAGQGTLLTNFYVAGTCSPTRSMLMSGVDHHLVGLGAMGEHLAPNQKGLPGYEGYLLDNVITIADRLKVAGYQTYMAGKWHLGATEGLSPAARGFDDSFVLLNGGASHLDHRGLTARTDPAPYRDNGKSVPLPNDFDYSTDFYTDRMINYIEKGRESGAPFLGYLAYTAPHWPLHALPEDLAKYKGKYDAGWDKVQQARFSRMKDLGLVPPDANLPKRITDWPDWDELSDDERAYEAKRMEIFAAMVDRVDQNVGELVTYLKDTGQYENTLIFFFSDNGSEGAALQDIEPFVSYIPTFDNSYDAIGTAASYIFLEERWAQVSGTPLRLWKGIVSDGGIKVPAFIHNPYLANKGERYDGVLSVLDVAPTLLDLAGMDEQTSLAGRSSLPLQGRSMMPLISSRDRVVRSETDGLGWELFTRFGYRMGAWKAIKLDPALSEVEGRWALYNVHVDPGETTDLSMQRPQLLAEMIARWEVYKANNNVVPGNTAPDR